MLNLVQLSSLLSTISKLSARNKMTIICQITTEKLDNAVQATKFINSIIPNPVSAQTVRRTLKEVGLHSATKKKVPMLKASHHQCRLKFARDHENWTVEDWKRVLWSNETKINWIGFVTNLLPLGSASPQVN